jgi:hypothetical protein
MVIRPCGSTTISCSRETLLAVPSLAISGRSPAQVATTSSRASLAPGKDGEPSARVRARVEQARALLAPDPFERAWGEGAAMSFDEAVAYALGEASADA